MSKRYTYREDHYIVSYFGIGSIWVDIDRTEASVRARAKRLKDCGAWDALLRMDQAQKEYLACLGADEFDQRIATLAR
jgi:hypothetical protein